MKIEVKNENVTRFARALIKEFGRAQSKVILNFLLENENSSEDIVYLAVQALKYMDPNLIKES